MFREELLERASTEAAGWGISLKKAALALLAVIALGIYIAILLFGSNSLTVLLALEEQRTTYQKHVEKLKAENARLQKEYFELKQVEPSP